MEELSEALDVVVRSTADSTLAGDWTLVLASAGIEHRLIQADTGWGIGVAAPDRAAAVAALDGYDAEAADPVEVVPPTPDQGTTVLGWAVALLLVVMYFVAGPREASEPSVWFRVGSASAELILRGQWWRALTALTLHADLLHLFGNAVASLIFITAVGRWLGAGIGAWLILLAGTGGNFITAAVHRQAHISVGASTATFAALGVLAGLQVVRRLRYGPLRRRAWLPLGAGLALFAMLGVGERSDVLAHLFGLGVGCALGATSAVATPPRVGPWVQAALAIGALATVGLSWLLAFT